MNLSNGLSRASQLSATACRPITSCVTPLSTSTKPAYLQHCTRLISHVGSSQPRRSQQQLLLASPRAPAASRRHASTITPSRSPPVFRVAIIGSGPAGFYSAKRLLQRVDCARVDMYEKLPVPFGLVRYGVAPDHPEVKNCEDTFNEVAESARFSFHGNVEVGRDISLASIRQAYDAVVFAYGAAEDRVLGIPGEDTLAGIHSARAFVGWYNGLPEYEHLEPDLQAGDTAVVVGQGNVALDVARVLLSDVDRLRGTDISGAALEALSKSRVKRVHVVGRRGPMQAAFTIKELRELIQMSDVEFKPIQRDLLPEDTKKLPRAKRRIADLLIKHSSPDQQVSKSLPKSWSLDFMRAPSAFLASPDNPQQLGGLQFTETRFNDNVDDTISPSAGVTSTEASSRLDASIAFRSIGYKSIPITGMESLGINFDSRRGIVPNIGGRIITSTGQHIDGLYCTGWVKNGPTGVIATTMEDAFGAAETLVEDWSTGAIKHDPDRQGWSQLDLDSSKQPVDWEHWKAIDAEEKRRGKVLGKEREKFTNIPGMMGVLGKLSS